MSMYKLSLGKLDIVASYLSGFEASPYRCCYWFSPVYAMDKPVKKRHSCLISIYPIIKYNRMTQHHVNALELIESVMIGREK